MDPHLHHHHHQHHQQQPQHQFSHHQSVNIDTTGGGVNIGGGADRFPQWSIQETRDFLMIRAELDQTFMETKRNKLLWEVIATKMKEKGYNRSPEQCKCKWKNLVTRYKGCETLEPEALRQQFPFYNELQAIFAARMQRMLWIEAEGGGGGGASGSKKKAISSDEEEENEDSEGEKVGKKKRKIKGNIFGCSSGGSGNNLVSSFKEIFDDFMKQQMAMEMQWLKAFEAKEEERRIKEMEWRQTMEALENERLMMERRWREREDQRRVREEARAEKKDALITALLNKLRREDHNM
ncbi:Trihelix transcription factor GT-3b [Capsicum chinense]|uniref:Trihelix transcription factor GT-3b n=1 Tax=Capsicum annuum TaxID=4072 RepID=A0A1U8EDU3_CAPAN|nr:trihelix transcription factor GT-3b [Capsicum annuum]KAF3644004.1 Trihelix transcription factor GT-3b [Capsicum annuum]KAF3671586.1 Trihelix transcription factor GT-3b [Capsicum annuum]PHT72603.1 Trihelix transcription factor GT-3b [Capsicum annuum]PHU06928.1 Trihelix transcription factor GT-3b [Capsicum chinense]